MTSGTAVANLYPALIEAGLTGEKLILLTADRPPELIDCGSNQAIRQPGMFASHPTHSISLPRPTCDIPARWLVSTIDHALGTLHAGGVHINCPFAEPLYGEMDDTGISWQQRVGDWWQDDKPWLREAPVGKVKTARLVLLATKARRGGCRAHECGRGAKSCTVGANSWLAADWRRAVANRTAAAVCRSLVQAMPKRPASRNRRNTRCSWEAA